MDTFTPEAREFYHRVDLALDEMLSAEQPLTAIPRAIANMSHDQIRALALNACTRLALEG